VILCGDGPEQRARAENGPLRLSLKTPLNRFTCSNTGRGIKTDTLRGFASEYQRADRAAGAVHRASSGHFYT
jgi:hypothetical protein